MKDLYEVLYPPVTRLIRGAFRLCGGFRVEGAEHVPRHGGVLLAANHVSLADPPALGCASPRPAWFMAKEILFSNRAVAWALRTAHAFPVDQEGVDREALRTALALVGRGEVVAIFPEGGCSPTGELQPFFPGMALIALRCGAPVIPAALLGTNRVMPYSRPLPRRAPPGVTVHFGPPVDLTQPPGMDRRAYLDWATGRVREEIAGLLADAKVTR